MRRKKGIKECIEVEVYRGANSKYSFKIYKNIQNSIRLFENLQNFT